MAENEPNEKKCAKCGACTVVCPVYKASGNEIYSARGKRHLEEVYRGEQPGPVFEDIYSKCLLCGACSSVCPRDLDIVEDVVAARSQFSSFYGEHGYQKFLARQVLRHPGLLAGARIVGKRATKVLFDRLPLQNGLRLRLAMLKGEDDRQSDLASVSDDGTKNDDKKGAELCYFPGCAASYLYPDIVKSVGKLAATYGHFLHIPEGLGCCGLATMAAGDVEGAKTLAKKNITILEKNDGPIMVSCGSCFAHLTHYVDVLKDDIRWQIRARSIARRLVEISQFMETKPYEQKVGILTDEKKLKVFYHDPCHLRYGVKITEEPRSVLQRMNGVELLELADGPQCCGQGGLFHVGAPKLSAIIRDDLASKIIELEPDVITTTCSGCIMQLKTAIAAMGSSIPVLHLATLVKERLP